MLQRKMLYEIYHLKISLNLPTDSEEEDETEADLVYATRFSGGANTPKPPTPPKLLNDNKVVEKLENLRNEDEEPMNGEQSTKSVTLVDANPEFLVTERDVLETLAENDVSPERIERIYKNLSRRSRDSTLCESVGNVLLL